MLPLPRLALSQGAAPRNLQRAEPPSPRVDFPLVPADRRLNPARRPQLDVAAVLATGDQSVTFIPKGFASWATNVAKLTQDPP